MNKIIDIRLTPVTSQDILAFNDGFIDIRLSDNFLLSEFTRTSYYKFGNYIPTTQVFHNIVCGVTHILQPLRDALRAPVVITSGYRSPLVNSCVGGAVKSQHRYGCAADIRTPSPLDYVKMRDLLSNLPFDQILTNERGKWLHVSWTSQDYCAGGRHQKIIDYYS